MFDSIRNNSKILMGLLFLLVINRRELKIISSNSSPWLTQLILLLSKRALN
jgi:hypothetical protein